ncbi:ATP-binding protein [Cellvibrio japonicus]|uniref:histidine kinase n=1 Tax=Cellvibrio japonicus (strain Ueda107) TaxID=498211 RepID=B3PG56_CELJU|nr:ATP-binding protein [Cellvibrio japonicus]ACE83561.1 probable two-component sensor [Cellvibrio japonicus Ueda107]QEI13732.1 HAMP domain-containing protein [Cellvibrio japonicus]QEI17306.1 HAMP domain-containing protein [Cellvibrio japonicus]QEI20883.1 HAMP domain-containing protein [Cellvibrio japonicus]
MKSIRLFLVLLVLAIVTLANFVAAVRGYLNSMDEAQHLFDERMYQQVDLLNYTLPPRASVTGDAVMVFPSTINTRGASLEFQWVDADGRMLARSSGMPETQVMPLEAGHKFANFHHYRWHVLVARSADQQTWYLIAERDDQRYRMAEAIILQAVYPMLIALPIVALIIWWVISIGLKPVRNLAQQLHERKALDLRPLLLTNMPQELRPLTQSANELLCRLEASFAREKRFSADAAHELRTPIAILRIHCENLMQELQPAPESLRNLQAGIERMSYLVEQILLLNRTTPDHFMGSFAPVNLTGQARQVVANFSHALEEKYMDIELDGDECWLMGDAGALESLLNNLLSNALKYTPAGGQILMATWRRGQQLVLEVMDNGPGIAEDQYDRVFDRFYRVHGDRHDAAIPGCGLGLSIVRQVVELHGGRVQLTRARNQAGLLVIVTLPALLVPPAGKVAPNLLSPLPRQGDKQDE